MSQLKFSTLQEDDEEEEEEETLEENEATESVRLMGRSIRWRPSLVPSGCYALRVRLMSVRFKFVAFAVSEVRGFNLHQK